MSNMSAGLMLSNSHVLKSLNNFDSPMQGCILKLLAIKAKGLPSFMADLMESG